MGPSRNPLAPAGAESVQLFQDLVEARFIQRHDHPGGDNRQSHRAVADLESLFEPAGEKSGKFTADLLARFSSAQQCEECLRTPSIKLISRRQAAREALQE